MTIGIRFVVFFPINAYQILNKLETVLCTLTFMGEKAGLILQEGSTVNYL